MPKLFGTSGIRMKFLDMSDSFLREMSLALGTFSKDKEVVIATDPRKSSPLIKDIFLDSLRKTGHEVIDLGIATTPTLAMASEEYGTGVMITASHNPPEYNGFKFWYKGMAFNEAMELEVERIYFSKKFKLQNDDKTSVRKEDYTWKHIHRIINYVSEIQEKVKILLDCANGSGSVITPKLLRELGCEVKAINTSISGEFPHGLEPTEENLKDVCKLVKKSKVDIGVVHDGDADRAAIISHDGKLIDWDSLLSVLAYGKRRVITTVDASMRIEKVCKEVIRTKVGDVAVANAILLENADFGGEPSGSFIFPEVHLFPDGVLTAAIVAKLVSEGKFYERLEKIESYPTTRLKIPFSGDKSGFVEKLKKLVANEYSSKDVELNFVDGVRLSFKDGWFLIRPSGTEPCIRITAEGKDETTLREIVSIAMNHVKMVLDVT